MPLTMGPAKGPFEEGANGLPDDSALPGLRRMRTSGLAATLPGLGLEGALTDIRMCNHHPGERAALEVRTADRRFAIKVYADDPAAEAEVYRRLSAEGLAGDTGPRVPRLLSWDRDLKILVLSWLEGPPANRLVKNGKGRRAGELVAAWLRKAATLDARFGPPRSGGYTLYRLGVSVGALAAADPTLGATAKRTAKSLVRTQPRDDTLHLVHGTLYARHVLDTGDGPGVIDWPQFGRGPLEVDAGMFLATVSRTALRHTEVAEEADRAKDAFVEGTRGLVDPKSLEWYWAASLLDLAPRCLKNGQKREGILDALSLLDEAAGRAERLENERAELDEADLHLQQSHEHLPSDGKDTAGRRVSGRNSIGGTTP